MSSKTDKKPSPSAQKLRTRQHVLERAQSTPSLHTLRSNLPSLQDMKPKHGNKKDDVPVSSHTDYISTESSDEEEILSNMAKEMGTSQERKEQSRPSMQSHGSSHRHSHRDKSSISPTKRAWYEFDLAVVVALVSPIGNWLTGGDHVKNLLLIVLLVFYLHQIIEGALSDPSSIEARYAELAKSELQKFELFFLALTFLSPFAGAYLLRYGTDILLGRDAVSWFSTGLFVLATGMRPWAHLVERFSERAAELHDFVHYPSPTQRNAEEQYHALEKRLAQLEKSLENVKGKVKHVSEDIYDYVDDAVDAVEHAMRKQDRKWEKYENKVKEVEQTVVRLSSSDLGRPTINQQGALGKAIAGDMQSMRTYVLYVLRRILPGWIVASASSRPPYERTLSFDPADSTSNLLLTSSMKRSRPPPGSASPSQCPTPLETIPEEEDVMYKPPPLYFLAAPYAFTSNLIYRAGYVLTAPLRAVIRMVLRNY
ncbi:hypothetical protein CPC08DRAFT_726032 [Agrocybe pediades]|nr:hypothetical protein CPC08DRAFT_726032 [Agrocybe pediades]